MTYFKEINKESHTRNIHWEMGPNNAYVHLCIDYPKHYNILGGFKVIDNAWRFIIKKCVWKYFRRLDEKEIRS